MKGRDARLLARIDRLRIFDSRFLKWDPKAKIAMKRWILTGRCAPLPTGMNEETRDRLEQDGIILESVPGDE